MGEEIVGVGPEPQTKVVEPRLFSARQACSSLDEVIFQGKDMQQRALFRVEREVERLGYDLGKTVVTWEVRVQAVGYQMPEEWLIGVEDDPDPVRFKDKMRERWLAQVDRAARIWAPIAFQFYKHD